ncbi:somatostatin-2-like isoform X2 [Stigmatopora argus]
MAKIWKNGAMRSSLLALALASLLCGPAFSSRAAVDPRRAAEAEPWPEPEAEREPSSRSRSPSQEWRERALEDFLADALASDGRPAWAGADLERSAETPNNLPPRERKAGCKNFYWKGFTSC